MGRNFCVWDDAIGIKHFAARPKFSRYIIDILRRMNSYPQQGRYFLKWFDQGSAEWHCDEDINRGVGFAHFVLKVRIAAKPTRPSNSQVTDVRPDCAAGYIQIEASAMVRNAIVWRMNLSLSITHQNPRRIVRPVNRLINMTNRAV